MTSAFANVPPAVLESLEISLPDAVVTAKEVEDLCRFALQEKIRSVCLNSDRVARAYDILEDSSVKVTSLVGFPLGANDSDAKRYETEMAVDNNAHEIEVVMNIGRLKDGDHRFVLRELRDVVEAADERPVKVIIETPLLTEAERAKACELVLDSGAQFISLSSGLISPPTTDEQLNIVRELAGPQFGIKAGGLRDLQNAETLLKSGANRIGLLVRSR